MALSLHGIFEGIALGVLNHSNEVIMLFIAIIAHKWAESFALGISFYKAKIDTKIFIKMLTLFTFFTPVGILIGMYFSKSGFLIEGIMLSVSSKYENKCIVTGSLCSPTDKERATYGGLIDNQIVTPHGETIECETTNGNALLIPRGVMEKVGILNYLYHHSRGDIDYGYRTRKAGFKILATPVFVGNCERHDQSFKCYDPTVPFKKRFQYLYSPLGFKPNEVFEVSKLKGGVYEGCKAVILIHLRTLSPKIWNYVHGKLSK